MHAQALDTYLVLAVCGVLILAVGLVFGQTVRYPFIDYDDGPFVYANPQVNGGLTAHGIAWALTSGPLGEWYPLSAISHMLDCQFYGLWAGGHHLTNVLLHAAASIALFLVLLQMTGNLWPSAFVAALFAIHPLHVESVAWLAERRDVLSGLFFMLTLGMYVRYVRYPSRAGYITMAVLFALGLMAKPILVTLPFVLLLLDYWPLGRFDLRAVENRTAASSQQTAGWSNLWPLVKEKIPLFLLAAADCAITLRTHAQGFLSSDRVAQLTLGSRIGNALVSYVAYLGQLLWPVGLAPDYPHPGESLPMWKVAGAAVVLTTITTYVIRWRRKCPFLLVGWFWYLGMMVPVIGLVRTSNHSMADRYTYLSHVGLYIAVAWGAAQIAALWPSRRWAMGIASAVVLCLLMGCAWRQTSYWRNDEALWTHTLACTSPNAMAECNLGIVLEKRGELDEAIARYRNALEIEPDNVLVSATAHNNIGHALAQQGKTDEAMAHYEQSIRIDPNYEAAYKNEAIELAKQGKLDEAIARLKQAIRIDPMDAPAHSNLATDLTKQGKLDEAITHYEQALAIDPRYAMAHYNLANALAQQGKLDDAIVHLELALRIDPNDASAHNNLANLLARQGKLDQAIAHLKQALKVDPTYAIAHNNLANALTARGNMVEALSHRRDAVRLQPKQIAFVYRLAWALATAPELSVRNGAEAVELADHAVQLSGGREPAILDALAASYAETGQFSKAVDIARQALALATTRNDSALIAAIQARIKLYQSGSAFREPRPDTGVDATQPGRAE